MKIIRLFVLILLFSSGLLPAGVRLPAIFSDHMVLKKTARVPVWGQADPGEEITITFAKQTAKTQAGGDGKWTATLDLSETGPGPFEMTVQGRNAIRITDVLVGEVWLASGQSNMQWTLNQTLNAAKEIAASANSQLREFAVMRATSMDSLEDCKGTWQVASPATSANFSAVAYYFGKKLH